MSTTRLFLHLFDSSDFARITLALFVILLNLFRHLDL